MQIFAFFVGFILETVIRDNMVKYKYLRKKRTIWIKQLLKFDICMTLLLLNAAI